MWNKKIILYFIFLISFISFVSATNLVLDDNVTEILEDGNFDEDSTLNGAEITLAIDSLDGTGEIAFIKFYIGDIPSNQIITNASLCFYVINAHAEPVDIWYSDNQTWQEETIDANCGDGTYCSSLDSMFTTKLQTYTAPSSNGHYCIDNLHSAVQTEHDASNSNLTFILNHTGNAANFFNIYPKEFSNVSRRLYLNITYLDNSSPTYTNWDNNDSSSRYNDTIKWNVSLVDNNSLDYYVFAHNISGTFANTTFRDISGTSYVANFTWTINLTRGNNVCGMFWFNNTIGNINVTNQSCFTVANTVPTLTSSITPSPAEPTENLTGVITYNDVDSDTWTQNETKWYNNSIEITALVNLTHVDSGNTSNDDIWIFSARVYDGYNWSSWENSSSVTIGDNTAPVVRDIDVTNKSTIVPLNTIVNLTANCTDASSNIDSVKFTYSSPGNTPVNLTTTTHYGDVYYYELTLTNKGNWTFNGTHCEDSSGNIFSNTSYSIGVYVDDSAPHLTNPTFSHTIFYSDQTVDINITCTDATSSISSAKMEANVSGTLLNSSMTQNGNKWYISQTYVAGTHTVTNFFCTDSSNNINMTSSGQSLIVTTRPSGITGGGGGGGGTSVTIIESNLTLESIIDFGVTTRRISLLATPSENHIEMAAKNIGDLDIEDATLTLTSGLEPYLDVCLYDLDTQKCETEEILFSIGETKILVIDGVFPKGTVYAEGQVKVNYVENEQDTSSALNIVIDRLPLYKMQMFLADKLNISEYTAAWVGAIGFICLLYVAYLLVFK